LYELLLAAETSPALLERDLGFKQSFLRGHSNPVGLIEVNCTLDR
jgi:hypothetical protein